MAPAIPFSSARNICNADHYFDGVDVEDDQCWALGYDFDVSRWTNYGGTSTIYPPLQDQSGLDYNFGFGSAHATCLAMAFCDGSVRWINYSIDPLTYRRLGNRRDGEAIDGTKF